MKFNKTLITIFEEQGKDIKFVGIHVRRSQFGMGDFEKYMQSRSEGGFYLSKAYFKTAMDYFRTKFSKKVIFVVSSDDQDWCIRNLKVNNFIDNPAMFDLALGFRLYLIGKAKGQKNFKRNFS